MRSWPAQGNVQLAKAHAVASQHTRAHVRLLPSVQYDAVKVYFRLVPAKANAHIGTELGRAGAAGIDA